MQGLGEVQGVVRDKTHGAAVPGATVVLDVGDHQETVIADEHGRFTLSDLAPGRRTLTVYGDMREATAVADVVANTVVDVALVVDDTTAEKVCTLIGCSDNFSIVIARPNTQGIWVNVDTYAVGTIDGKAFRCSPVLSPKREHCSDTFELSCDGGMAPDQRDETPAGRTCTRELLTNLVVAGAPHAVAVTVLSSAARAGGTFTPSYEERYPNGHDCDQAPCRTAADTLVVR